MKRYVEGWDRRQTFLLPECLDDDGDHPFDVATTTC